MVRRVLCRAIVVAPGTQGAYIVDSLSLAVPRKGLLLHQAGWEVVLAAVVRECVVARRVLHVAYRALIREGGKGRRKDYYWNRQVWG